LTRKGVFALIRGFPNGQKDFSCAAEEPTRKRNESPVLGGRLRGRDWAAPLAHHLDGPAG
jgi:hypothetical protein